MTAGPLGMMMGGRGFGARGPSPWTGPWTRGRGGHGGRGWHQTHFNHSFSEPAQREEPLEQPDRTVQPSSDTLGSTSNDSEQYDAADLTPMKAAFQRFCTATMTDWSTARDNFERLMVEVNADKHAKKAGLRRELKDAVGGWSQTRFPSRSSWSSASDLHEGGNTGQDSFQNPPEDDFNAREMAKVLKQSFMDHKQQVKADKAAEKLRKQGKKQREKEESIKMKKLSKCKQKGAESSLSPDGGSSTAQEQSGWLTPPTSDNEEARVAQTEHGVERGIV